MFDRIKAMKITLPSVMWVLSSLVAALSVLLGLITGAPDTEFVKALLFSGWLWSSAIVVADSLVLTAMLGGWRWMVRGASFISFMMWLFGALTLVGLGDYLVIIFIVLPYMIIYAYLYLTIPRRNGVTDNTQDSDS